MTRKKSSVHTHVQQTFDIQYIELFFEENWKNVKANEHE